MTQFSTYTDRGITFPVCIPCNRILNVGATSCGICDWKAKNGGVVDIPFAVKTMADRDAEGRTHPMFVEARGFLEHCTVPYQDVQSVASALRNLIDPLSRVAWRVLERCPEYKAADRDAQRSMERELHNWVHSVEAAEQAAKVAKINSGEWKLPEPILPDAAPIRLAKTARLPNDEYGRRVYDANLLLEREEMRLSELERHDRCRISVSSIDGRHLVVVDSAGKLFLANQRSFQGCGMMGSWVGTLRLIPVNQAELDKLYPSGVRQTAKDAAGNEHFVTLPVTSTTRNALDLE